MTDPTSSLPIEADLMSDAQSLAEELHLSWSQLIEVALREFIHRHYEHKQLIDQINLAYSDDLDADEQALLHASRSSHRHLVEGEW